MTPSRPRTGGFTLIELMIVVAIMSVLALIAIPRFAQLVDKSREAGTLGHLSHTRSAILLYYMENEQVYPENFGGLLQSDRKYIKGITDIRLYTGDHLDSLTVDDLLLPDSTGDSGNWSYVTSGIRKGDFYIQCTHLNLKGDIWSQN